MYIYIYKICRHIFLCVIVFTSKLYVYTDFTTVSSHFNELRKAFSVPHNQLRCFAEYYGKMCERDLAKNSLHLKRAPDGSFVDSDTGNTRTAGNAWHAWVGAKS